MQVRCIAVAHVITIKKALGGRLSINVQVARACSLFSMALSRLAVNSVYAPRGNYNAWMKIQHLLIKSTNISYIHSHFSFQGFHSAEMKLPAPTLHVTYTFIVLRFCADVIHNTFINKRFANQCTQSHGGGYFRTSFSRWSMGLWLFRCYYTFFHSCS